MPDPMRPRASLRTAVVWDVLQEALERRIKATGRESLDVLDTGGGSGNFAVPLAGLGHRVTVVDPSPNALFALERRAAEAGVADRVQGVQGDAHGLVVDEGAAAAVGPELAAQDDVAVGGQALLVEQRAHAMVGGDR